MANKQVNRCRLGIDSTVVGFVSRLSEDGASLQLCVCGYRVIMGCLLVFDLFGEHCCILQLPQQPLKGEAH